MAADWDLQAGLGLVVVGQGTWVLRAGRGSCSDDDGYLHFVALMVVFTRSLKWTDCAVFLKL